MQIRPRLLCVDFELVDTSLQGEVDGPRADEQRRLKDAGDQLRKALVESGKFIVLDITPVHAAAHASNLQACGGCDVKYAQQLGADLAITGVVRCSINRLHGPFRVRFYHFLLMLLLPVLISVWAQSQPSPKSVDVRVQADQAQGAFLPIWNYFGYDEPNYTYAAHGEKLLGELAAQDPAPVYVRVHNLLTTGDGSASLKWGSTGVYSEGRRGKPGLQLDDTGPDF